MQSQSSVLVSTKQRMSYFWIRSRNSGYCDLRASPQTLIVKIFTESFVEEIKLSTEELCMSYWELRLPLLEFNEALCTILSTSVCLSWLRSSSWECLSCACPPARSYVCSGVDPVLGRLVRGGACGVWAVAGVSGISNTYVSGSTSELFTYNLSFTIRAFFPLIRSGAVITLRNQLLCLEPLDPS